MADDGDLRTDDLKSQDSKSHVCLPHIDRPVVIDSDLCLTYNNAVTQTSEKSTEEISYSDSPQMSQSHMEQVHDMMADAMKESSSSEANSLNSPSQSIICLIFV